MIKNLIVYAHPYEEEALTIYFGTIDRFKIVGEEKVGPIVTVDLHEDGFNPVYTRKRASFFGKGQALITSFKISRAHFGRL